MLFFCNINGGFGIDDDYEVDKAAAVDDDEDDVGTSSIRSSYNSNNFLCRSMKFKRTGLNYNILRSWKEIYKFRNLQGEYKNSSIRIS